MTRHLLSASIVLLATCAGLAGQNAVPAAADASAKPERRVALIIGNSSYPRAPLRNPVHDARAMKTALEGLGFKTTMLLDADKKAMDQAIAEFGSEIRPGDIALFYYAGHGVQVKDLSDQEANYLIPAGFDGKDETDVKYGAVHAGIVLDRMERAKSRLNLLILDACRITPSGAFTRAASRRWTRRAGTTSPLRRDRGKKQMTTRMARTGCSPDNWWLSFQSRNRAYPWMMCSTRFG